MFIRVHGGKKSHVYAVYTFHWQKYNNFSAYNVSKKISRCICRWECTHYQNHIPSPWLQHVTMIAPNHQGYTLDTMVTPWAELIHRTRITSWAELLSAFQADMGWRHIPGTDSLTGSTAESRFIFQARVKPW
jgi:hypothetical protein